MLKNKNIILLFFAYFINLIGITNSLTGLVIFTSKMYGFTDSNLAKGYSNIAQLVSVTFAIVISILFAKAIIKQFGEVRVIILSQYFSIVESLINFSAGMPMPQWLMYITQVFLAFSLIFYDAIFLQLITMYTSP